MTQPNILWICTDSQRWDTLGCYGNSMVSTPNIDRLASEGILFEHAYAVNPLCTPSRGNFLTGRYPITNKLRQNGQCINADEVLVPRILNENRYICGLSGKLHLSACDYRLQRFGSEAWRHDFSEYFDGIERRINDGYTEFWWDHAPSPRYRSSSYTRWVEEQGSTLEWQQRSDCDKVKHGMPEELHQTRFCVQKAMDFIKAYKDARTPWLFSVNMFDPHLQLDPVDRFLEPYLEKLDEIPLPNYHEGELDNKPAFQAKWHEKYKDYSDFEHRMCRAAYWAMCDHIDYEVGRLMAALEESGQREDTLVIFTSDHGELLGDHGGYIKGPFMYDCSLRVPLIMSMPGRIEQGVRSEALVELGDLAPTVLELADIEPHPGMQARSLWPLVTGKEEDVNEFRDEVYAEYLNSNPGRDEYRVMIRTRTHKIITSLKEPGELYDMQEDPGETHNLWHSSEHAQVKSELLERAVNRLALTCDPLPERIGVF